MSLGALETVQAQLSWTGTHILQRSILLLGALGPKPVSTALGQLLD